MFYFNPMAIQARHIKIRGIFMLIMALAMLAASPLAAKGYFNYNARAKGIYAKIFELRLDEATAALVRMKAEEPDNLVVYHLENYVDFFTVFVSEDVAAYRRLKPNMDKRLAAIGAGNAASPYFLYTQAEIRLHWALLKFRFEEYYSAFLDINRAHKMLVQNQAKFPDFLGNKKDLGILHAAVGTIPDNYRWALSLVSSLEGTVGQGKAEVAQVLAACRRGAEFPFQQETQVLYAFLLLHLDGRPEAAWAALDNAGLKPQSTPLHAFVLANVAMRTGRNEDAIRWIAAAPRGGAFFPFPYLDYMHGVAKLRRLDTSGRRHLSAFITATRGRHYIKEAYQKLAWADLLDGNAAGYKRYMQSVVSKGTDAVGGDQNALREAESATAPHTLLLKARLLYDGGYYDRALALMTDGEQRKLTEFLHQLEFVYRKGRILHGLERYAEALVIYDEAIAMGQNSTSFFACNAALQAGMVEEKRQRKDSARRYYQKCLSLKPTEYKTGLHQQAKAGLSRLG